MGSKNVTTLSIITCILLLILAGVANSDFAQDKAECADQLVSLATCLPYVGGQAKAPTLDCCSGIKQVLQKSMKCLCILIKDRNDPQLGLKFDATLAAKLPSSCNAPTNVKECIDILHLSPSSPDAKEFARLANLTNMAGSSPATSAKGNSTSSDSRPSVASVEVKSAGGGANAWLGLEIISGFLLWVFTSSAI